MQTDIDPALLPFLPPQVKLIAQVIGIAQTLRLIEAWPGVPLYVPRYPELARALREVLSHDAVCRLCDRYGGETLDIPNLSRARASLAAQIKARAIRAARDTGKSARIVALEYGLTRRRVVQIGRGEQEDNAQSDLFGGDPHE